MPAPPPREYLRQLRPAITEFQDILERARCDPRSCHTGFNLTASLAAGIGIGSVAQPASERMEPDLKRVQLACAMVTGVLAVVSNWGY